MSNYIAILFDLDGTLIDSEEHILTSFRHALSTVLGVTMPDEMLRDMIGIPLRHQMQRFDTEHIDELLEVYREYNLQSYKKLLKVFPHTASTLAALKDAGYRLAVVTSKMTQTAVLHLDLFGLTGFFEFVQGSDMTEHHKPDPEPLFNAAARMGLEPEQCVYVGDSPYDMTAARAAGMLAVGALWGMFTRERLLDAGAQLEATTISELPKLFEKI